MDYQYLIFLPYFSGSRCRDRMVVGFTTTYMQSVPITTDVVGSTPAQGDVYNVICDKVCQQLATGRWFSLITPVSSSNKSHRHNITEILLKVPLNTIKPNQTIDISVGGKFY